MTIYDIAKEAQVAASTVSRVINNKPGIRKETRERIEKILHKYDFKPDAAARGLVMKSSKMIGILIQDIRLLHHINSAFIINQNLTKKGYCCITMSTGPEEQTKCDYIKILEKRRIEGLILMGSMFETEEVANSIKKYIPKIPVVIVNGYINLPNVTGVVVDEKSGIEQCVHALKKKGKKKIIFVLDSISPSNLKKKEGYIKAMESYTDEYNKAVIYNTLESSLQGGYLITQKILDEHPDVDGIIYSIDLAAAGGLQAATERNVAIPNDLAIIGVNNSLYGQICIPQLSTLDNKLELLSEMAAEILIESLGEIPQSQHLVVQAELKEYGTT